jgi:hypothetical protein
MKSKLLVVILLILGMFCMLSVFNGCSNRLVTRSYKLHDHDAGFAAISNVLKDEWQQHSVMSHADVKDDIAVVKTTARSHRKIEAALKLH